MKRPNGDQHRRHHQHDPREVEPDELLSLNRGDCPTCHNRGFVFGPRGGINLNIECAELTCRERYNVAIFAGAIQAAQRIEKRSEGGGRWPSEPE